MCRIGRRTRMSSLSFSQRRSNVGGVRERGVRREEGEEKEEEEDERRG